MSISEKSIAAMTTEVMGLISTAQRNGMSATDAIAVGIKPLITQLLKATTPPDNPYLKIFDHKWLDPVCVESGCQSLRQESCLMNRNFSWHFWKFVHNTIIHPWLGLPYEPKWLGAIHDWTAERCKGGG